uniref:Uncharacterized protein n=1 Tax=Oryza meridionalis TaxID=40149 RepID=A0A0E0EQJ4_9ORYZ
MEAVAKDLEEMMHGPGMGSVGNGAAVPTEYHISIVKSNIRDVDPWQYKPYAVMVGPYHHDAKQRMEKVKLSKLLDALPSDEQKRLSVLEDYLIAISGLLRKVRPYYGDGARSWDDKTLSRILLVDGFYILHVFGVGSFGGGDGLGAEEDRCLKDWATCCWKKPMGCRRSATPHGTSSTCSTRTSNPPPCPT